MPPVRNLELCINRGHLHVETMVATPFASGSVYCLSTTRLNWALPASTWAAAQRRLSVFVDGHMVHLDAIAVGGNHVTTDIARAFATRLQDAERLKTLYGSPLASSSDDRDLLTVPPLESDGDLPNQIPRSALTRVIRPRVEEILELVRDRLTASGFAGRVGKQIVLTGGASQLTGLRRSCAPYFGAQRPSWPAIRRRRSSRGRQRSGFCRRRRPPDLSASRSDRTVRTQEPSSQGGAGNLVIWPA